MVNEEVEVVVECQILPEFLITTLWYIWQMFQGTVKSWMSELASVPCGLIEKENEMSKLILTHSAFNIPIKFYQIENPLD